MLTFLRQLFSTGDGHQTVIIMNDDGSKPSSSHRLSPFYLWLALVSLLVATVILVVCSFMFTPLGSYVYNQGNIRERVVSIQQRVAGLEDTLQARESQLAQIKEILLSGDGASPEVLSALPDGPSTTSTTVVNQGARLAAPTSGAALRATSFYTRPPAFPVPYPVRGIQSRMFSNTNGHYGLDISADDGAPFRAIAPGVIISQEWTLNFGYVLVLQHEDGLLSVYKHAGAVEHNIGDTVQQNDILGSVGDVGVLSSGPHLHIEMWDHGVALNPQEYLTQNS